MKFFRQIDVNIGENRDKWANVVFGDNSKTSIDEKSVKLTWTSAKIVVNERTSFFGNNSKTSIHDNFTISILIL